MKKAFYIASGNVAQLVIEIGEHITPEKTPKNGQQTGKVVFSKIAKYEVDSVHNFNMDRFALITEYETPESGEGLSGE